MNLETIIEINAELIFHCLTPKEEMLFMREKYYPHWDEDGGCFNYNLISGPSMFSKFYYSQFHRNLRDGTMIFLISLFLI